MATADLVNRFTYHPPRDDSVVAAHQFIRSSCLALAQELDLQLPDGREKSLAITKLEETMFWANAAIARSS